jgi:hypothetical protein
MFSTGSRERVTLLGSIGLIGQQINCLEAREKKSIPLIYSHYIKKNGLERESEANSGSKKTVILFKSRNAGGTWVKVLRFWFTCFSSFLLYLASPELQANPSFFTIGLFWVRTAFASSMATELPSS